jgi:hypothetical protein
MGASLLTPDWRRSRCFGVGVFNVPFTIPAASAKTSAGVSPLHALLRPALLA